MQQNILIATIAFILGATVGNFALGQKNNPDSVVEVKNSTSQDYVVASTDTTGNSENNNSQVIEQNKDTHQVDLIKGGNHSKSVQMKSISESEHISLLTARWINQENQISQLEKRIRSLEQKLVALEIEPVGDEEKSPTNTAQVLPLATPEDRRVALETAGVSQTDAEEIVWRQSELELERLGLKDQAMREGWYRTDQYYEAIREIDMNRIDLRTEIGEQSYDEYLYQTGEFNRVKIASVIQGSAAEQSGLVPGDIIEIYGDNRIYGYSDLLNATSDGERGESVPILIRRGEVVIETDIARGPMGVNIEALTVQPNG